MTMLSKEDWQKIETQLSHSFGEVKLMCDGYEITAQVQRKTALKYVVVVYVNGQINGEWMKGEAEEAKKFHRAQKHFLYKPKARALAREKLKSRRIHPSLKDHFKHVVEASTMLWYGYWPEPAAFCRQLRKTCTSIEIIKLGFNL
jgi:hypothetical protein